MPLKQQAHIVCHLLSVITTFYTVLPSVDNVQRLYEKCFRVNSFNWSALYMKQLHCLFGFFVFFLQDRNK